MESTLYKLIGDIQEYRSADGKVHNENGPARKYKYGPGGSYSVEEYLQNGQYHNDSGPARILNGPLLSENSYFRDGKLHNENGPAIQTKYKNGTIHESWYLNGTPMPVVIVSNILMFLNGLTEIQKH